MYLLLLLSAYALSGSRLLLDAAKALRLRPRVPPGALGPPSHFDGLDVGTQFLAASRECSRTGDAVNFEIVRLSSRPACFHIGGLLSAAECDHLMAAAAKKGTVQATTAGGDLRQGCAVAWLPTASDETVGSIAAACEQLLLSPEAQDPSGSDWARGADFENLQCLAYSEGGEFKLHHDANEQTHRMLTVLLYLNGAGETWFPLAVTDPAEAEAATNPPSRAAAITAAHGLLPGRDGVRVSPAKGDAVAFYNFVDDGSCAIDRLAVHAGLPAPAEKHVAALWYHVDLELGRGAQELGSPLAVGVGREGKVYNK